MQSGSSEGEERLHFELFGRVLVDVLLGKHEFSLAEHYFALIRTERASVFNCFHKRSIFHIMAMPCGPPALRMYQSGCLWAGCFGPLLGQLGPVLGHLGLVLGLSWGHLGRVLGCLRRVLSLSWLIWLICSKHFSFFPKQRSC